MGINLVSRKGLFDCIVLMFFIPLLNSKVIGVKSPGCLLLVPKALSQKHENVVMELLEFIWADEGLNRSIVENSYLLHELNAFLLIVRYKVITVYFFRSLARIFLQRGCSIRRCISRCVFLLSTRTLSFLG